MARRRRRVDLSAPKPLLGPQPLRSEGEVRADLANTPRQDLAPVLAELASLRIADGVREFERMAHLFVQISVELANAAEAAAQTMAHASQHARFQAWLDSQKPVAKRKTVVSFHRRRRK
jgi:aminoglycoside phosphotransferase (APT) family kinase protein